MSFTDKLDALMGQKKVSISRFYLKNLVFHTQRLLDFIQRAADNVKLSTLKKLSTYFDCSIDFLADDEVPSTMAAHLDGKDFTKEQWSRIKSFADFIKLEDNK